MVNSCLVALLSIIEVMHIVPKELLLGVETLLLDSMVGSLVLLKSDVFVLVYHVVDLLLLGLDLPSSALESTLLLQFVNLEPLIEGEHALELIRLEQVGHQVVYLQVEHLTFVVGFLLVVLMTHATDEDNELDVLHLVGPGGIPDRVNDGHHGLAKDGG